MSVIPAGGRRRRRGRLERLGHLDHASNLPIAGSRQQPVSAGVSVGDHLAVMGAAALLRQRLGPLTQARTDTLALVAGVDEHQRALLEQARIADHDVVVVGHDRVGLRAKALLPPALEQEPAEELGYAEIACLARGEDAQHAVVVIATGRA